MDKETNIPTEATAAQGNAAYRFLASKKEPPAENEGTTIPSSEGVQTAENDLPEPVEAGKPKEPMRKKRTGASFNYAGTFLHRYELSSRQGLHLEKETIATIKRIISSIGGDRLTVSGFVENVLKHHFELYKEEVNRLHDERLRKPIE